MEENKGQGSHPANTPNANVANQGATAGASNPNAQSSGSAHGTAHTGDQRTMAAAGAARTTGQAHGHGHRNPVHPNRLITRNPFDTHLGRTNGNTLDLDEILSQISDTWAKCLNGEMMITRWESVTDAKGQKLIVRTENFDQDRPHFDTNTIAPKYDQLFDEISGGRRRTFGADILIHTVEGDPRWVEYHVYLSV